MVMTSNLHNCDFETSIMIVTTTFKRDYTPVPTDCKEQSNHRGTINPLLMANVQKAECCP
jgi:hypothetical protein